MLDRIRTLVSYPHCLIVFQYFLFISYFHIVINVKKIIKKDCLLTRENLTLLMISEIFDSPFLSDHLTAASKTSISLAQNELLCITSTTEFCNEMARHDSLLQTLKGSRISVINSLAAVPKYHYSKQLLYKQELPFTHTHWTCRTTPRIEMKNQFCDNQKCQSVLEMLIPWTY